MILRFRKEMADNYGVQGMKKVDRCVDKQIDIFIGTVVSYIVPKTLITDNAPKLQENYT